VRQGPLPFISLVARTDGDAAVLQAIFRSVVTTTDRTIAVTLFQTLESGLGNTLGSQRIVASLTSVFAGLAVLLSMLGLYSVLAYAVTQRTSEIGIRLALGASSGQVLALVLRHGLKLVVLGLGVGLAITATTAQLLQSLLFEIEPVDPLLYAAVTALFALVALLACLLPARRATKVDPLIALRAE
jgi:putative ABC transport system permease protein